MIAILEDDDRRQQAMRELLRSRHPARVPVFFDNAPEMLEWLTAHLTEVSLVSLDHDLGPNRVRGGAVFDPGSGREVANFLAKCSPHSSVIVHTSNPDAGPGMLWELQAAGWSVCRVIPYGDLEWVATSWAERVDEFLGDNNG